MRARLTAPVSRLVSVACVAAVAALLTGCGGAVSAEPSPTPTKAESPLVSAAKNCGIGYTGLSDENATLFLDMKGKDFGSGDLTYVDVNCVLERLKAPQSVRLKMDETRALDGRQSDSWGDIDATWSYHPDNGLDVILEWTGV